MRRHVRHTARHAFSQVGALLRLRVGRRPLQPYKSGAGLRREERARALTQKARQ